MGEKAFGRTFAPGSAEFAVFLLELEDKLRTLEDPVAVQEVAVHMLGQQLVADHVIYETLAEASVYQGVSWSRKTASARQELDLVERESLDLRRPPAPSSTLAPSAMLNATVKQGGRPVAVLSAVRHGGEAWRIEEQHLTQQVAERCWIAIGQAQARLRLQEQEALSRARAEEVAAIYATAPVGLCVLDREGRYLRINDVLAASNGLPADAHLGHTVRELFPELATVVEPLLDRCLAGEELRGVEIIGITPAQPGVLRTWRESWAPLRNADGLITGVSVSVEEITEERAAERRRAYLFRLEERLRAITDAGEAIQVACESLGQELGAALVGHSRFEDDGQHIVIEREWRAQEMGSTLGRHRLADYGSYRLAALGAGEMVVVSDVRHEARIGDPSPHEALGVRAFVEMPLVRDGRLRGHVFVCDGHRRDWTPEELTLVRETVDRAWQAAERANAEAELRDSEARFRQLAEAIREVFYIFELDEGRLSYVSPAYEGVWGRPASEALADHQAFVVAIHPDDRPRMEVATARLRSGLPVSEEYRLLRPDGSLRYIRDHAVPATDPSTGRRRAIGLAADVTEWRRVEERLQLATEAAGLGIFDVDLRTGAIEWDARLRELWGIKPELTVTDAVFMAGLHPEDRPVLRSAVDRAVDPSGDGLYRAEYRLSRAASEPPCWIAAMGRVHFEGGRAVRLIGTVQDISGRKSAEAAVAESEERFRALANTVPALIFISAPEQGNIYSNERYQIFTGLGREGLLGDGWRRVIHPEDLPRVTEAWKRSWASGQDYAVQVRVRRHDGVFRWHLTRGIPVRDAKGSIVQWVGTGTDIDDIVEARDALAASRLATEQANAELEARVAERTASLAEANARLAAEIERREAVQAALVQSQKLEAVGQLTSGVAHDFNNVIAAIAGGFSVIERRTQDPRLLEVARHGAKAAERGGALVKQLLAFARQQVLEPRPCDLATLLAEAEPLIARSLGSRVGLLIDCPDDLRPVRVDPVQLEAALINLAVNARDAMESGGRVLITARPCSPDEVDRPDSLGDRPAVTLSIADTGTGMTPDVLARALDPFFTTKEPGRGTGLGLAMVHGFVHQSGGALRIDSEEGRGTSVTLWLPTALEMEEHRPTSSNAPIVEPADGATLLLVDDDAAVRGVTAAQLQDAGYVVLEASCAEEALALLGATGEIAVVLSDVAMPDIDGVQLAAEIRKKRPDLPILFMTGYADRDRLQGEAVVDKPFNLHVLLAALAERRRARH